MADEEAAVKNGQGEEAKKGGSMMKLIIIGVVALVLLAGGFFGLQMFMGGDEEKPANGAAPAPAAKPAEDAPVVGAMVEVAPFIVNLADPGGKRYLKLTISLDVGIDEIVKAKVEQVMPRIRDSLLLLLSSKTYADISSVAGKVRLRNEVLKIVNRALAGTEGVHAVYFTEFVIQ